LIDSDGQVVRTLRVKMSKTERWIDRTLREDACEAVGEYLKTRRDSLPRLFISQSQRTKFHVTGPLTRSAAHLIVKKYLVSYSPRVWSRGPPHTFSAGRSQGLINCKTSRIETAQEWLGHSSTAHTRAYIEAEDYTEKANGVVAALDV